ncbi:MAG: phosphoribosyltransferase family protein [bacterium]|nr:phosphoribosyltransferase family protein [bacterium]
MKCPVCHVVSTIGARCEGCVSSLDGLIVAATYSDPVVNGLLRRWKFSFVRGVESYLESIIERAPISEIVGVGEWTVVPVPLHAKRFRWRGFDQAAWIALTVGKQLNQPAASILKRSKFTKQQARRGHGQRSRNELIGSFETHRSASGRIILCDDVVTSGATLEAAAHALKEAGASSVWGFVIARS